MPNARFTSLITAKRATIGITACRTRYRSRLAQPILRATLRVTCAGLTRATAEMNTPTMSWVRRRRAISVLIQPISRQRRTGVLTVDPISVMFSRTQTTAVVENAFATSQAGSTTRTRDSAARKCVDAITDHLKKVTRARLRALQRRTAREVMNVPVATTRTSFIQRVERSVASKRTATATTVRNSRRRHVVRRAHTSAPGVTRTTSLAVYGVSPMSASVTMVTQRVRVLAV